MVLFHAPAGPSIAIAAIFFSPILSNTCEIPKPALSVQASENILIVFTAQYSITENPIHIKNFIVNPLSKCYNIEFG